MDSQIEEKSNFKSNTIIKKDPNWVLFFGQKMFKKPADPLNQQENLSKMIQFSREFAEKNVNNNQLLDQLNHLKNEYRFPAIDNEVGSFLKFIVSLKSPKRIFEFGSGYGHSAFWYLQSSSMENIEVIHLTERRDDLKSEFENLSWPNSTQEKIDYFQGDAFKKFSTLTEPPDLVLLDGQKSQYLVFLKTLEKKLDKGAIVLIDNAFWKGKILDENDQSASALAMKSLYKYLNQDENTYWDTYFLPLSDGLLLLLKVR